MRGTCIFAALIGLARGVTASDLLWNNYQGDAGFDGGALSSERNTVISDAWVVDDADFETPVEIDAIRWIGLRGDDFGRQYQMDSADFLILDAHLGVVAEVHNTAFTPLRDILTDSVGRVFYEAQITVADLKLPAGEYFFGTRLVDDGLGRNRAATTGNHATRGLSAGLFRAAPFGVDDFTPVQNVMSSGRPSDFAFQVYGTQVPEPATALLLVLLGLRRAVREQRG